jgi:hypothetical protein
VTDLAFDRSTDSLSLSLSLFSRVSFSRGRDEKNVAAAAYISLNLKRAEKFRSRSVKE